MSLLNFGPMNTIPPAFGEALAKAERARNLAMTKPVSLDALAQAVQLLSESNRALVNVLTENQLK